MTEQKLTQEQINEVTSLIINTWDFCGNARVAVGTWQLDNNIRLTEGQIGDLFEIAHIQWDESLK